MTVVNGNRRRLFGQDHPRYRWIALSNTTLGVLMATVNASIVIISLPAIFDGIGLKPLEAGNVSYLLWMLMGYLLVSAVFVISFGRLGDQFGRVRIYNLGFVVFAVSAIALSLDPFRGGAGALWLIGWRVVQGIGGAMLMANSTAILTDAFPANRRGLALGTNQVAAIGGSFIGLIVGGLLSTVDWHWVFLVSVPVGVVGTIWSYLSLQELGARNPGRIDWPGNIAFAVGLTVLLAAITYGIQPYGSSPVGWGNPLVIGGIALGIALLVVFVLIERRSPHPMFALPLFRIRAFTLANLAGLLASIGRGGLQFMLIIWLQGIWLPLHGYDYAATPFWAAIYLLPLTVGFLVAGPISGILSDRFGARFFATAGLLLTAATFVALLLIPVDFSYPLFAAVTFLNGIGNGMFGSPNRTAIMNSVPASQRGSASGLAGTLLNSGTALSIGVFFSLMIAGLSASLPATLKHGLDTHGVSEAVAGRIADTPPVGSLFAAFLGSNPIRTLLEQFHATGSIPKADLAVLTGQEFFPDLISGPFHDGLVVVFLAATIMLVIAAAASLARGRRYVHADTASVGTTPRVRAAERRDAA